MLGKTPGEKIRVGSNPVFLLFLQCRILFRLSLQAP